MTSPTTTAGRRTLRAARLHLINWPSLLGWPWAIVGSSFAVNLAIMVVAGEDARETFNTGGLAAIYIMAFVASITAMTQWFPFALGLSVTRTRYYLGTALLVVAQAVVFGLALLGLLQIEKATDGWGVAMEFFGIPFLVHDNPALQLAIYTVPMAALSFLGMVWGAVFARWGQTGVLGAGLLSVIGVGALVFVLTWRRHWPAVGSWFTTQSPAVMLAGWPLLAAVVLAATGFLILRRAVP